AATAFNGGSEIDLTISGGTLEPPVTYDFLEGLQVNFDFNIPLDNYPYDNQALAGAPDAEGVPLQPTYGSLLATALGTPLGGMFGAAERPAPRRAMAHGIEAAR
ncbi:MAG TPA: hypothetical protein VFA22_01680, partial [Stellaceae bacterium]|nr:hypothetical protein [Stellaceae bacterium]